MDMARPNGLVARVAEQSHAQSLDTLAAGLERTPEPFALSRLSSCRGETLLCCRMVFTRSGRGTRDSGDAAGPSRSSAARERRTRAQSGQAEEDRERVASPPTSPVVHSSLPHESAPSIRVEGYTRLLVRLPIRLRVISCTQTNASPKRLLNTAPQSGCKPRVPVGHNRDWNSMQRHNTVQVDLGKPLCRHSHPQEMCRLRKSVHKIASFPRLERNQIHGQVLPLELRNG